MMPRHIGAIPVRSPWKTSRACFARMLLLPSAEQLLCGDAHVVEEHLARRRRVHAHLLHRLAGRQTRRAALDDERVDRPMARILVRRSSLA